MFYLKVIFWRIVVAIRDVQTWLWDLVAGRRAWPTEHYTAWAAVWEVARIVERRELRFVERREMRFAERQARAAELRVLLAAQFAASEAGRHSAEAGRHTARIWAIFLGLVAVVLCCVLFAFIHSQTSAPIPWPPIVSDGTLPTSGVSSSGGNVELTWLGWSALAAGIVVFLCIGFIISTGSARYRAVATALAVAAPMAVTGLSGLSLFKGGSLLKIEHVHFSLPDSSKKEEPVDATKKEPSGTTKKEPVEATKKEPVETTKKEPVDSGKHPVELSLEINVKQDKASPPPVGLAGKVDLLCKSDKGPLRVGTFVSGKPEDLEENDKEAMKIFIAEIGKLSVGKQMVGVLLVGSADKTHLTSETERLYDSNFALAQIRARWVEKQLIAAKAEGQLTDLSTIVVLNAGPTYVGPKVDVAQLAEDRSVRACLMVQPTQ
jgi:hypothetical protein